MYKISLFVLLIAAFCTAIPLGHEEDLESEYEIAPRADRLARATCDLLSASVKGITINHAACAAHCLVIGNGNRGGRCINGVCHCRK